MEKLIELLNEYNEIHNYAPIEYYDDGTNGFETNYVAFYKTCIIISKQFWFIKWLVDNDKINNERIDNVVEDCWTDEIWAYYCKCYWTYESLLMLLATQDEPIEFLISILK